jgi:hypothetical protein
MRARHCPDCDIIDCMSKAKSSELFDGVVANHSNNRETFSAGERGTGKGLLPQVLERISSPVTGEN